MSPRESNLVEQIKELGLDMQADAETLRSTFLSHRAKRKIQNNYDRCWVKQRELNDKLALLRLKAAVHAKN